MSTKAKQFTPRTPEEIKELMWNHPNLAKRLARLKPLAEEALILMGRTVSKEKAS